VHIFDFLFDKNALFFLMLDTYNNFSFDEKRTGGFIREPNSVINETKDWIKDEKINFLDFFNDRFTITNNPNDHVESKTIINYLTNDCKLNISATKIGLILGKLITIEPKVSNIRNKTCRNGIKENSYSDDL